jgi:hypothetical protein
MALVLIDVVINTSDSFAPVRDSKIPLTSVQVQGDIIDFVGKIKVTQTYQNKYDRNIEAKYMFNLDGNSTVTGMSLIIGDRILKSKIQEKSEARQTYETAIVEKKTTSLLEKASNGIYTMNIGNIQPNQEVKIEFEYLTTLECTEEGHMKFVLPTNISPKYDDQHKTVPDMLATRATTTSMVHTASKPPFDFHVELNWKSNNTINEVKSYTNEIEVNPLSSNTTGGSAAGEVKGVKITCKTAPSNGDFNVFVTTAVQPTVYVHATTKEGVDNTYLMINHRIPDEYPDVTGGDFIIIVDRSGSMADQFGNWSANSSNTNRTKMDYAREATELFIQSLPANSKFNIVSFGNSYECVFPTSVLYTEESKQKALTEVAKFDSNLGGTELFQCLSDILSGRTNRSTVGSITQPVVDLIKRTWTPGSSSSVASSERSATASQIVSKEKIIILMTDGDVGNVDAITGLIRQYNHNSRVFAIGIGQDVNRFLVEKVAKSSNAYCEILVDNPDISTVVAKMLDTSMKSFYKNLSMKIMYGEGNTDTVPLNKVIYPNQFMSFFHKMSSVNFRKVASIEFSCQNGITEQFARWNFGLDHSEGGPLSAAHQENTTSLPQLYAADHIRSLEENNEDNRNTSEIIKLSVEYSIMNMRTSFVVVDEQTKRDESAHMHKDQLPMTVDVPQYSSQAATTTFAAGSMFGGPPGVGGGGGFGGFALAAAAAPPAGLAQPTAAARGGKGFSLGLGDLASSLFGTSISSTSHSAPLPPPPAPMNQPVMSAPLRRQVTDPVAADYNYNNNNNNNNDDAYFEAVDKSEDQIAVERMVKMPEERELCKTAEEVQLQEICKESVVMDAKCLSMDRDMSDGNKRKKSEASVSVPTNRTDDQKMDELLKYKKVDGSFTYSSAAMNVCGWQYPSMTVFASRYDISEELAFNLWVLKFLKSDSMKANKKFVMIVRNLEKWLNESLQLHFTNKNTNLANLLSDVSLQEEAEAGK